MALQIFVLPGLPLTEEHKNLLWKALPEAEIKYFEHMPTQLEMQQADFIFGNPPPPLLEGCDRLKLLQLRSAGVHGYLEAVPHGAKLLNATGAYGLAVSEHMLGLLFTSIKKIDLYLANQQESSWKDEGQVSSIDGSTILIIGLGDIGTHFAKKVHALGAKTIGIRRHSTCSAEGVDEVHTQDDLDEWIPKADVIALSLPDTPQTYHMINRERLAKMKKSAVIINAGRGRAIDTEALCDALDDKQIAGAGLDVTDPEPLPPEHRLWKSPRAIVTPHVSGHAHLPSTVTRIVQIAADNFRAYLDGTPLRNEVDPKTGY